ncbi:hypothetical protein P3339_04990 [Microbulbifer sp. MLAF003]|uniref:hypothetical protein n=1 Tax=Microbulbifer sp. MLAF003 TaxID=3032582 RepID=UPI0024AD83FD|nr:hypothetical protein [Microbulbifer sp. MLAF003]WHI52164.1 hypothetical protein P3339_04990 [Microbulbifer sp. MLAF003]
MHKIFRVGAVYLGQTIVGATGTAAIRVGRANNPRGTVAVLGADAIYGDYLMDTTLSIVFADSNLKPD